MRRARAKRREQRESEAFNRKNSFSVECASEMCHNCNSSKCTCLCHDKYNLDIMDLLGWSILKEKKQ